MDAVGEETAAIKAVVVRLCATGELPVHQRGGRTNLIRVIQAHSFAATAKPAEITIGEPDVGFSPCLAERSFVVSASNPDNMLGCIVDDVVLQPVEFFCDLNDGGPMRA